MNIKKGIKDKEVKTIGQQKSMKQMINQLNTKVKETPKEYKEVATRDKGNKTKRPNAVQQINLLSS